MPPGPVVSIDLPAVNGLYYWNFSDFNSIFLRRKKIPRLYILKPLLVLLLFPDSSRDPLINSQREIESL